MDADFGRTSEVAKAAAAYFSQEGGPSDLLISRWNKAAVSARTYGGKSAAVPAAAGKVAVNGVDVNVPFVAGDDDTVKTAARLQNALAGAVAGTNVAYDAARGRYEISWGGATSPTIGEAGANDVAVALGLDPSISGFSAIPATEVETIAEPRPPCGDSRPSGAGSASRTTAPWRTTPRTPRPFSPGPPGKP